MAVLRGLLTLVVPSFDVAKFVLVYVSCVMAMQWLKSFGGWHGGNEASCMGIQHPDLGTLASPSERLRVHLWLRRPVSEKAMEKK